VPNEGESKREPRGDADRMSGGVPDVCVADPAGKYSGTNGSDTSIGMVQFVLAWGGFHNAAECVGGLLGSGGAKDVEVEIAGKCELPPNFALE
jgi:hypothetical protein